MASADTSSWDTILLGKAGVEHIPYRVETWELFDKITV
jgi:hypothetical protein